MEGFGNRPTDVLSLCHVQPLDLDMGNEAFVFVIEDIDGPDTTSRIGHELYGIGHERHQP